MTPPALSMIHFFYPGLPGDPAPKEILGGKGHSLAAMSKAALPVPPGFTISTRVCKAYHEGGRSWPAGLEEELRQAMDWLEARTGRRLGAAPNPLLVAVRSGAAASMPGMMDTVLNTGLHPGLESCFPDPARFREDLRDFVRSFGETVRGLDENVFDGTGDAFEAYRKATGQAFPTDPWTMLKEAVAAVFESWNNERAIKYRQRNNVRGLDGTAVTVMAMFPSQRSGILFTEDPNRPDEGRIILEASTGLGEAIVRGHVEPDTFTVDRATRSIRDRRVGTGERACLSDEQALQVIDLGLRVEAYFGTPVDVEWAIADGALVLLQSRAVRGLDVARAVPNLRKEEIDRIHTMSKKRPGATWAIHNLAETLPAPTPLTWDLVGRRFMTEGFVRFYRELGFTPSERVARDGFLELIAGRIYADLERSAELFFDDFPMEYDVANGKSTEALLGRPTKFNIEKAGLGFLFKLPLHIGRMVRAGRVLKRLKASCLDDLKAKTLPAFRKAVDDARARKLDGMSDAQVLAELDARATLALVDYGGELLKPGFLAGYYHGRLTSTLEQALGEQDGRALAARLLTGLEGDKTVESNILLWKVSTGEVALEAYLKEFGHRGVAEFELAEARWSEDAGYVRQRVEQYRRVAGVSPAELHERKRKEREAAEAALDVLLAQAGAASLREEIRADLAGAQRHMPWRETCKHWFILGLTLVREAVQELAERWDLGKDIYYLKRGELDRWGAEKEVLRATIKERRLRWQAFQKIAAPDVLRAADAEALGREEAAPASSDGVWTGLGVATGTGTGPARILMSPADAGDLGAGYVLVCPTTDPAWTPLFINAAGLVVERGGMLSHGAIVARDFGIPAVVLRDATKLLADGASVKVDGGKGRVELVRK
ncbi:MAG TPA: PEP/pyruvate-binding domain-containing protein [Planctomycetota bacterium]